MDIFDRIGQLHQEFINRHTPVEIPQLGDDHSFLEIPYGRNDELIMDIPKYLPCLKEAAKTRIEKAYEDFNKQGMYCPIEG